MSYRSGWVRAGIAGALVNGAALVSSNALAQQVGTVPTQAGCCQGGTATGANEWTTGNYTSDAWTTPGVDPAPGWWSHGELEVGGRAFTNDPLRNGSAYLNQHSLAKYYEYTDIAQGAFGGGHVATGSKDGLYQVDLWANNVGYDDQSYFLNASKVGEQYLTLQWDQSPHLYSTSAQTPFVGVGTTNLVVPHQVTAGAGFGTLPLNTVDIGIKRDTAAVTYRWTPTDDWDFNVDYSHLHRSGSQMLGGVIGLSGSSTGYVMVPTPVDDTTQNYGLNGEYSGTSLWGQGYTVKLGYRGSDYKDGSLSYNIENPISGTTIPTARESMWPSNQANGFTSTTAADLPAKSRLVSTVNYTAMTQNSPFIPMSANFGGAATSVNPLPANSLDGEINTLMSNNVLTTKLTPELTNKLSYRYYDFDNQTPQILFDQWISRDQNTCAPCAEHTIQTLTMSYIKQNAGEALNWRPTQQWNFNAEYGFERYQYQQADVNATNQSSAKLSADWKPSSWLTARASGYYSDRRYENYNYNEYVASTQFPTVPDFPPSTSSWFYSSAYTQLMYDNRQQGKGQFAVDIVAFPGVTISPSIKYQDDNYGLNKVNQMGLTDNKSLSWGADFSYTPKPDFLLVVSYYREYYDMSLFGSTASTPVLPTAATEAMTSDKTIVDTVSAGVTYAAIPDKLDLDLRLALSRGTDQMRLFLGTGVPSGGQLPNDETWFRHLDATATYKVDPETVAKLGWKGDVKVKLRYTWESNSVANWQNNPVAPFFIPGTTTAQNTNALFMAADNPNYNVQMIAASLVASW